MKIRARFLLTEQGRAMNSLSKKSPRKPVAPEAFGI